MESEVLTVWIVEVQGEIWDGRRSQVQLARLGRFGWSAMYHVGPSS